MARALGSPSIPLGVVVEFAVDGSICRRLRDSTAAPGAAVIILLLRLP